jgi:CysZ protein
VALRRMDAATVTALRTREAWTVWTAGAIATALLSVPVLNLVAPVVGMAAMVHIFHKLTLKRLN